MTSANDPQEPVINPWQWIALPAAAPVLTYFVLYEWVTSASPATQALSRLLFLAAGWAAIGAGIQVGTHFEEPPRKWELAGKCIGSSAAAMTALFSFFIAW